MSAHAKVCNLCRAARGKGALVMEIRCSCSDIASTSSTAEAPQYKSSTGSFGKPYLRGDGVEMTKWGLHVPLEFVERFKWFMGHLGLTESASEFVVRAVLEKMAREIARRKQQGTWKNFEEMSSDTVEVP
jgi:hypothetical protein